MIHEPSTLESVREAIARAFTPDLNLKRRGEHWYSDRVSQFAMYQQLLREAGLPGYHIPNDKLDHFLEVTYRHELCVETVDPNVME